MKKILIFTLFALLTISLASCGADAATTSPLDMYVSTNLPTDYENALSARNQLALGTLNLAGTALAPTSSEAQTLIPLWQALRSLQNSGVSAPEEVNAIMAQIETSMRPEQLQAIAAMKLTNTTMQEWAAANGLQIGTGAGVPGQGQGMSPEARATKQAEMGITADSSGGSKMSSALIDMVVTFLQTANP